MTSRLLYGISALVTLATSSFWLVNINAVVQSGSFFGIYVLPVFLMVMALLLWVEKRLWASKEPSPKALVFCVASLTLALYASDLLRW